MPGGRGWTASALFFRAAAGSAEALLSAVLSAGFPESEENALTPSLFSRKGLASRCSACYKICEHSGVLRGRCALLCGASKGADRYA